MDHTGQPDLQPNGFVEPSYEFSSNFDRVHTLQPRTSLRQSSQAYMQLMTTTTNTVASRDSRSGGPRWVAEQSRGRRAKSFGRYLCDRGKESETGNTCSGKTERWILDRSHDARFRCLLQSHRAVKEGDLHQINSMRKSGLRVPTIFRAFANQSGGFETVRTTDFGMFWKYSMDVDKRLENLFWCDGTSCYDYSVFGDVLGFDATYGRIKYKCPLVLFSWVNYYMRTVVFGCAILSNESEGSYVWLLRSFLEAMKGK
ncbi:hypothetical protein AHAS_Ahas19G0154900 [Arachis hypogaea]